MPKALQILFVDNSDDDVLELLHHLRNAGHEVCHERVETDEAMLTALKSQDWDVILCEYHLPKFDAQTALRLAQNCGHTGPFLVVSSAIGDELAVADLMKAGAHDLILKDRLERLVPAIERELKESNLRLERNRAIEDMEVSEQRFRDIVETISDWLWEMDADLRYSYFSPSYEQHSGIPIKDAVGRTRDELYAEVLPNLDTDDIEQWDKFNQLVKTRRTFRDCGTKWVGSNGKMQYLSTSGRPIFDQDGKFLGYRGVGTNITARKLADKEREFLISELEAKNTELERFVYTISHELKSPLVTIAGFSGILLDDLNGGDNKKLKDHVQRITTAVGTMSVMLDDLLELSRIGRIIHTPEAVALVDLAHEVVNSIKSQAVELDISVEIASDLPVVYGDRARLREALQNMIENAIKFCDSQSKPHVKIGSRKQATETVCYVQDNGKGIDPKYHEKVFGLFERLDPTVEGTGIGLTLVHRILEEHGGRVWVESEGVGKGSCFCFTIPQHEDH
jgi:PAS domain S-box-containing protein